jgi:outer membrane protein TolC
VGHRQTPFRAAVRVALLLSGLLGAHAVRSQQQAVRISLPEALATAERQSPDLAAARAHAVAAGEGAEAARRAGWPRVGLSAGWSYSDIPSAAFAHKLDAGELTAGDFALSRLNDPAAVSHLGTALAVEAPVDAFGKVQAGARSAAARAQSVEAQVGEGLLDVRLRVVQAYRQAALARRALEATEHALDGARAREADVQARVDGGAALQADLLRSRSRRREREADLAERRGEARAAAAALARALGAPAGTLYEPADDPPVPTALAGDLDAWTARALAGRPALAGVRASADAARWAVTGADKEKLPDVGLWGQLQDNRVSLSGGKRAGAVGVTVRWSAFDPERGNRKAEQDGELRAADQVRLDVEIAWHRAQAARERYAAAAGGAEEGREALRVVRERRQAGIATLTDELETEAASLGAELQELRAAAEAALADAVLERAGGGALTPAPLPAPPAPPPGEGRQATETTKATRESAGGRAEGPGFLSPGQRPGEGGGPIRPISSGAQP